MSTVYYFFVFVFVLLNSSASCQIPQKQFNPDSLPDSYFVSLKKEYGNKKTFPPQLERQILIALSYYPELKNIPIRFRVRPQHGAAYTRVTIIGLFEPAWRRHYVVTFSDTTEDMLMPLVLKNVSFNRQVGVVGHELGHIADPSTRTTLQILRHVIASISARHIDRFEYNTDAICISHGLGYQLLDWSNYVRKTMNTVNWDGPDYVHRPKKHERYMNPSTILQRINELSIYK